MIINIIYQLLFVILIGCYAQIKSRNGLLYAAASFLFPLGGLVTVILIPSVKNDPLSISDKFIIKLGLKNKFLRDLITLLRKNPSFSDDMFSGFDKYKPYQIAFFWYYLYCLFYLIWLIFIIVLIFSDSSSGGQAYAAILMLMLIGTLISGAILLIVGIFLTKYKKRYLRDSDIIKANEKKDESFRKP